MFPRKYRIHAALALIGLVIIFLPMYNEKPDPKKAEAATAAVNVFLHLVDADQFAESYQIAASMLKEKVTEQQWVDQLAKTRAIAGARVERVQKSMIYSTTAQDSPDGEYILITYDVSFKRNPKATETLTLMLDKDSTWRVAGYFIQ